MGNTASKTSSTFEPRAPTEVTANLKDAVSEITDTDFAIDQKNQAAVQKRVASALKAAQQAASARIDEGFTKLKDAKLNDKDLDAKKLLQKVEALQKELDVRPKKGVLNNDALDAREELVECLKGNKEKPLLCYEKFEQFKDVVYSQAS